MKKGMIKFFNEEKNFGFIVAEDGNDYFFHNSQNKSMVIPQRGMEVSFDENENEKGLYATNIVFAEISVKQIQTAKKFVSFGNDTLKVSNIKSYGMSKTTRTRDKQHDDSDFEGFSGKVYGVACIASMLIYGTAGQECYEVDYLYVTTYQNDNYIYVDGECGFDIHEKKSELDELFGAV